MQDQAGQNQQSTAPRALRYFKANVMHVDGVHMHSAYPNCSVGVGGSSGVAGAFKVLWASPHKRIVLNNNSSVAEKWTAESQAADR